MKASPTASPTARTPSAPGGGCCKNVCLDLLAATQESHAIRLAAKQYQAADNMTDRMAALATLSLHDVPERQAALDDFYNRYKDDPLIIDKWFVLQATTPDPKTLDRVKALTAHPAFSMSNPNRVRSLITSFAAGNPTQFNRADGAGYEFIADKILAIDPNNPQVASRMSTAFKSWRALERGPARPRAGGAEADRGGGAAVARRRRYRAAGAGGELAPAKLKRGAWGALALDRVLQMPDRGVRSDMRLRPGALNSGARVGPVRFPFSFSPKRGWSAGRRHRRIAAGCRTPGFGARHGRSPVPGVAAFGRAGPVT